MERLEVKHQEGEFEQLPGILTLEDKTTMKEKIRGQHSSGKLDNGDQDLQESRL